MKWKNTVEVLKRGEEKMYFSGKGVEENLIKSIGNSNHVLFFVEIDIFIGKGDNLGTVGSTQFKDF